MTIFTAHFPIQGDIANPSADDYALEASLLRDMARDWRAAGRHVSPKGRSAVYEKAVAFERTARRLEWATFGRPNPNSDRSATPDGSRGIGEGNEG